MDMGSALLLMGITLPLVMGTTFLLCRHLYRRQQFAEELSPVIRQHIHIFQGGQVSESEVESAKDRFRALLERGEVEAVEASLRPGTKYVIHVRALAEIGTEEASQILERQLERRHTNDQIEQAWYWIDLASSLRTINRSQSLPFLLRCAEDAEDLPLGHFFAAETVCFMGFGGMLRQFDGSLGRTALRILHQALEGLRYGVQPQMVAESRLGELIENVWDHRPEGYHPLIALVFQESIRLLRRAAHAEAALADEPSDREAFQWQISRVATLEGLMLEYLREAPPHLCSALKEVNPHDHKDLLHALTELRGEAAQVVLPLLEDPDYLHAEEAVDLLTWSRDPAVGPWLRQWAAQHVPMISRAKRRRSFTSSVASALDHFPYQSVLRALRGHPSRETEAFLLLAARDWDPTYRAAAFGSLGWWEPLNRPALLAVLKEARRDNDLEVRRAARSTQARLGDREALQWFRQVLVCEDSQRVHEGIQAVAVEGLTWLWPDLDELADSDDPEIAYHAREALERLSEDLKPTPS